MNAQIVPVHAPVQLDEAGWERFLARSDMRWDTLPLDWDEAPFVGNGRIGAIGWQDQDGTLRFEVSRCDVYDHRHRDGWKAPASVLYTTCRLPNGHFSLSWPGTQPRGSMRLDLWNAELRGGLAVGGGDLALRCFVHAELDVIVLRLYGDGTPPELTWHPDPACSTRTFRMPPGLDLVAYPPQQRQVIDGVEVSVQAMPAEARYHTEGLPPDAYATAWLCQRDVDGMTWFVSVHRGPAAAALAAQAVRRASEAGLATLATSHRDWWHAFYPRSMLSVPEPRLESFYWIQVYKMGSASRRGGPLLDLMGPWFRPTDWPAIWWNLNIQLTFWPFYMANHLPEAEPLLETLWSQRANLERNAAPHAGALAIGRASGQDCRSDVGGEVGNLPWAMHNLWLHYRSCMDDGLLRERILPLMHGSFRFLRAILIERADGTLALPPTASPEYADAVGSCSYTLACLRWLATTLLAAHERLVLADPLLDACRDVLARLEPYPIDSATGFMVGADMPLVESHRHWSHLFMIHPFHEYGSEDPRHADLVARSLANWTGRPERFAGYSWLGAAMMHADAGQGDVALGFLRGFLARSPLPNTLYREGNPVIETPLACARALQEMLLTSHGGVIRIFPGVPQVWPEAVFADLRSEGAFLISARRREGQTRYVRVTSLAGEPCRIRSGLVGKVRAEGGRISHDAASGVTACTLARDQSLLLFAGDVAPAADFRPLDGPAPQPPWGGRA